MNGYIEGITIECTIVQFENSRALRAVAVSVGHDTG